MLIRKNGNPKKNGNRRTGTHNVTAWTGDHHVPTKIMSDTTVIMSDRQRRIFTSASVHVRTNSDGTNGIHRTTKFNDMKKTKIMMSSFVEIQSAATSQKKSIIICEKTNVISAQYMLPMLIQDHYIRRCANLFNVDHIGQIVKKTKTSLKNDFYHLK